MTQVSYPYKRIRTIRYIFISIGIKRIEKVVDFVPLGIGNWINIGFGDLQPDGSIDDHSISNNGDLVRVLTTVIDILKQYTSRYPKAEIFFEGSTIERTRLYSRIIKTYYSRFSEEFAIAGVVGIDEDFTVSPFDPAAGKEYLGFVIKRKL